MSARPCRTGCGHDAEGRADLCAAHRKRAQRNGGDPLPHIPVQRKPSRKPDAVAERMAQRRGLAVSEAVRRSREAYAPVTGRTGKAVFA